MSFGKKGWETLKSMKKLAAAHLFIGTTASGAFFLSNLYFVDKWRSVYESLDSGFPSPLKKEVNDCFIEVLNDMKLEEEKDKIKPFKTGRLGMYHVGYPKFNILVGIPWYFEYNDIYEAARTASCWGKPVEWYTPEGEQYRETLVLNKNEKKFAIAREISEAKSMQNYLFAFLPLNISIMSLALLHYIKSNVTNFTEYSKRQKRGCFFVFYSFVVLTYFIIKDGTNLGIEYEADVEVSNIGLENDVPTDLTFDYIKGGIEYYNKVLIRNKLIKDLYLPEYIKWIVTDEGDLSQYFRKKHASILIRKKELEAMLINFEKHGKLHLADVEFAKRAEKRMEIKEAESKKISNQNNENITRIVNPS